MLSLFTAIFTNAVQASLDGTRCRDIGGKKVSNPNMNTLKPFAPKHHYAPFSMFFFIHFLRCWEGEFFLTIKSFFSW